MSIWPFDPNLKAFGATYTPAAVAPGQPYWRLVAADGPIDIGDNHHIYVDVWDETGNRIVGVPVVFYSPDEIWPAVLTEAKPGEHQAANFPMYAGGNAYGVFIGGDLRSDYLFGMGMASFKPHHCFRLVFQRTIADGVDVPTEPTPEPPTGKTARQLIDEAIGLLEVARGLS